MPVRLRGTGRPCSLWPSTFPRFVLGLGSLEIEAKGEHRTRWQNALGAGLAETCRLYGWQLASGGKLGRAAHQINPGSVR
ncbi:hypothetical protein GQ53DRAFT_745753 [Thozetella sp. PMI_491]|nr:hypothetical protein GQ53DRAFT_745753 [Thozetella sp. PMI_491]